MAYDNAPPVGPPWTSEHVPNRAKDPLTAVITRASAVPETAIFSRVLYQLSYLAAGRPSTRPDATGSMRARACSRLRAAGPTASEPRVLRPCAQLICQPVPTLPGKA